MSAPLVLPSLRAVRAEKARRSLAEFIRQAWHVLEPANPLVWGWHIDAICEHLEAVTRGDIRQLIINVPPGHSKSLCVDVFWPAWIWTTNPHWRSLFCAHSLPLATRDSKKCRDLVESDWYQKLFRPTWKLAGDQNVKTNYETTDRGARQCLAIGGSTGFRGDMTVVDDPLPAEEHPSDEKLENVRSWYDFQFSSRLNDMKTGRRVVIMQRLHERDLSGHLIDKGTYEHLMLPSEFDPSRRCVTSIGWEDPRTERGELMCPEKFPAEVIEEAKGSLGDYGYSGQHDQNPAPSGGGIFKEWWWRFWWPQGVREPPPHKVRLPDGTWHACAQRELPSEREFTSQFQSWDMTFKDEAENDYVAGGPWAAAGADCFLLDLVYEQLEFVDTCTALQDLSARHPGTIAKYVEDKANGPAVISQLKHTVPGLIPVEPKGNKTARARAVSPIVQAGNVYLPHPALFPWVSSLLYELKTFPKSAHDDRTDMITQALTQHYLSDDSESVSLEVPW